jgi:hypothetical protein
VDIREALRILRSLYDGVDPFTGEIYESDSALQNPNLVRALGVALAALERRENSQRRQHTVAGNAGKPWSEEEDKAILSAYDAGRKVNELAKELERSTGAIKSRLARFGKIPPASYKSAT